MFMWIGECHKRRVSDTEYVIPRNADLHISWLGLSVWAVFALKQFLRLQIRGFSFSNSYSMFPAVDFFPPVQIILWFEVTSMGQEHYVLVWWYWGSATVFDVVACEFLLDHLQKLPMEDTFTVVLLPEQIVTDDGSGASRSGWVCGFSFVDCHRAQLSPLP